jgi:tRNA A37 methylthiotransferase MiaB
MLDFSDTSTARGTLAETPSRPKRFTGLTWGCLINVDDSDQIDKLLLDDGLVKADSIEDADVVMLNTCSVRQKPEYKVYSELGRIAEFKAQTCSLGSLAVIRKSLVDIVTLVSVTNLANSKE